MSAFLGPIHFWLYHKITIQEELVQKYLEFAKTIGLEDLQNQVDEAYGILPKEALETIIDEGNIHGWLQEKVSLVEARLAMSVTKILSCEEAYHENVMKIAYNFGVDHAFQQGITPEEAYKQLNDILVDGMPCDHVNVLVSQTANEVVWQKRQCVHEKYWSAVNGNVAIFYDLRHHWIEGMISQSGLVYTKLENDCYRIGRE